ncbi:hypothetical protein ABBQ38_012773 [Trebouxia sp. C0009 RCD-2024]
MSMVLNTVVPTRLCGQSSPTGPCLRPTQSIRRVAAFTTRSPRRSRDGVVKAQAARPVTVVHAVSVGNRYTKVFDSEEAQADMRFVELQEGEKKILVISAVAPGSTGEKEGLKVGQQVLAVSDPVNEGQMLSLESQPSKMALIRAMNMRRYPEIEMVFSSDLSPVASKIIDGAGRSDVRRALEAQEVYTDSQESMSAKRNARKSDFMAAQFESKTGDTDMADQIKSKNNFALIAGLGFFVIPLAFLAVAYFSGYLSRLGAGSSL